MCCCLAEFIVKYVLIIANIIFSIAGIAIIALGSVVVNQQKDIEGILPAVLNPLAIGVIVVGCAVFIISFLACCGAIRESRCMLITYAVFMAILAGVKIYFTVVIYNFLDKAITTVSSWIESAFEQSSLRDAFHAMETIFKCCGTTGPESYVLTGSIPPSCCASPIDGQCPIDQLYGGCNSKVGSYFENFGEAIGAVLITVIIVEAVCVIFGLFLSCQIRQRRYAA